VRSSGVRRQTLSYLSALPNPRDHLVAATEHEDLVAQELTLLAHVPLERRPGGFFVSWYPS
jgi:hypothetical protein